MAGEISGGKRAETAFMGPSNMPQRARSLNCYHHGFWCFYNALRPGL